MFIKCIILSFILIINGTTSEKLKCQMTPVESKHGIVGHCCLFVNNISEILVSKEVIGDYKLSFFKEINGVDKISSSNIKSPEDKYLRSRGGTPNENINFPGTSHLGQKKSRVEINKNLSNGEDAPNEKINFPGSNHQEQNKSDIEINKNLKPRGNVTNGKINFPGSNHQEQNKSQVETDKQYMTKDDNIKFSETMLHRRNQSDHEIDEPIIQAFNGNQNKSKSNDNASTTPDPAIAMNRNAVDSPDSCPEGTQRDLNGNCVKGF